MRLYDRMARPCRICRVKRAPDGRGGQVETCECGESFRAAVIRDEPSAPRIAEKTTEDAGYTVTTDRPLCFGTVFAIPTEDECMRFRIISTVKEPPVCASFRFFQYRAEAMR